MYNYLERLSEFENNTNNVILTHTSCMSWETYISNIKNFASKLLSLDVKKDECVSIMGFNHPSWFISAIGSNVANIPFSGVYPTNGAEEVKHNLDTSNTSVLVIENNKLLHQIDLQNELKAIVVYNDEINNDLVSTEDNNTYYVKDELKIPIFTFNEFVDNKEDKIFLKDFDLERTKEDISCYIFTS